GRQDCARRRSPPGSELGGQAAIVAHLERTEALGRISELLASKVVVVTRYPATADRLPRQVDGGTGWQTRGLDLDLLADLHLGRSNGQRQHIRGCLAQHRPAGKAWLRGRHAW